ncbi:receptor-type guanylate cyclase gcy-28, partial [Frankliniella occidentalis]|uniref:guanylate cyclase n=1 Tax=Frankliniella occidentalis TaxID=133901 RepID=A0A9C6XUR0_FRAOC
MFQNKTAYPTLTRMSYCQCRLVQVFAAIFHQFAWRHVALILDKSDLFSLTVGKNLEHGLRKAGLLKYVRELDGNEEDGIEGYLTDASMYARVVILSVRGVLKRRFMLTAHTMGMTRGDWTFLDVDIFHGSFWGDRGWAWGDSPAEDADARHAYEALLRVSLLVPTSRGFVDFADKVRLRAFEHYNYNFSSDEEVNFFIGAFYDGVQLLGMALNETLTEGGDITDGVAVTRRMWNREFDGITGHVRIDDSGDRDADYSVLDLDPITGRFEEVAHYSGLTKNYTPLMGKQIHWPGGSTGPPPDVPACGFMNTDPQCTSSEHSLILTSAVLAVCLLLAGGVTVACVAYRRMKEAADLHNMSWRVRPEEVLLEVGKTFSSRLGLQKNSEMFEPGLERLHCRRCSAESGTSLPPAQVFTTIGIYKGSRVAIKKITKTRVDITKKLLWEVKQVRDVSHENTVRFVGACVQAPCVIILTEYCPKGSLRDVLENDALKLDWNLRMSLIHDLVKGMVHLHSCELGVHGKLRSGNCLIDSRFVLKVSDFGLATLTAPSEVIKDQAYYTKMLWIGPELLPLTMVPGTPSSQKGDVYSFAIILEEIVTRAGPFEAARQLLSAQEVVARVQARESPPLRPVVASGRDCPEALLDLMGRCWADSPDDRPSFEAIRGEVRRIMKGYCENLMDDLLRRMEQYATNLEALVEEKTAQLSQEKRRSEELLYQVLPRWVSADRSAA